MKGGEDEVWRLAGRARDEGKGKLWEEEGSGEMRGEEGAEVSGYGRQAAL